MKILPDVVIQAWEERDSVPVLTTVAPDGTPNSIYVRIVGLHDSGTIIIANNKFDKTKGNILAGCRAALLFLTKGKKAYQIKGSIELQESGPLFDEMKKINPPEYPGHSVAVLRVEEVYCGAEKLA